MMEIPEHIKQFVIAVRTKARQDTIYAAPSQKSMVKLVIEIESRLINKKNRKPVLQAITGLPLMSQKNLTQWYISTLIDEVIHVSENHPTALKEIEGLLESGIDREGIEPWQLFPWEHPQVDVSVLRRTV